MKKYFTVFKISWQNGFVYRANFLLWRIRSVILIITVYFLWEAIFREGGVIFGYTKEKILTYVFLTLIIRSIALGLRSIDSAGEISDGKLANYLLKPVNYHLYWFVRDLADKVLNLAFSVIEIILLYFILKPPIYFQTDLLTLFYFLLALFFAVILNFLLGNLSSNFSFWMPGNAWGFWFVYLVTQDLLGGVMFPLDIFPRNIYQIVTLLPFPYLLYFPANIYLGKIQNFELLQGLAICSFWVISLTFILSKEWKIGLKTYQAEGR